MGAFGIFFLCLTFFYLLYYAAMILMDIYGKKARQVDGVEEFKVGVELELLKIQIRFLNEKKVDTIS